MNFRAGMLGAKNLQSQPKGDEFSTRYVIQARCRMKIYDQNLTGASAAGSGKTLETQRSDRTDAGQISGMKATGNGDRVEFSSALGSLARAMTAFGSNRTHQVQALAAQYRNGSYQVDASATAGGIIADALSAGGK